MYAIPISHRGRTEQFQINQHTTVGELREQISQVFGVEPNNQKLLGKGIHILDGTQLVSQAIPPDRPVILMGTPSMELDKWKHKLEVREQGRINYQKYQATRDDVYKTRDKAEDTQHTFDSFEVLSGLPKQDQAHRLLKRLAEDEGVRQIMKRRKYSVGLLKELHPSEQTILGYNRNRGEVIALRLRTDDLEGFRDYLSVRRVLMHELAHMVWDKHDENFHQLNREHCREVIELDWTQRGQTIQPAGEYFKEEEVDGGSLKPDGFVLGGHNIPKDLNERRELTYKAWKNRNNK